MGRILFLDDMEDRHREFLKVTRAIYAYTHEVVQVYRATDAIKELESGHFDQVFLDHDLSIDDIMVEVGGESKVPTGMTVVDHIMKMERPPLDVVVHSCNGPARMVMGLKLEEHPAKIRVGMIPFPNLIHNMWEAKR